MQSLDRLVIMLVASFFLCFTPLEIYHLLNIFNMGIRSGKDFTYWYSLKVFLEVICGNIENIVNTLPWFSPVMNPILYSFFGKKFRYQIKSLVRRISHRKKYFLQFLLIFELRNDFKATEKRVPRTVNIQNKTNHIRNGIDISFSFKI